MSAEKSSSELLKMNCSNCGEQVQWPRNKPLPDRLKCPFCKSQFAPNIPRAAPPLPRRGRPEAGEIPLQQVGPATPPEGPTRGDGAIVFPAEPWYYGYLALSGQILFGFCLIGLALLVLVFLIGLCLSVYTAFAQDDPLGGGFLARLAVRFGAWLIYLVGALLFSFGSFFSSAILLLGVDVARNVRWQRLLIESKTST